MAVHYGGKLALHLNRLVRELTSLPIDQCSYILSDGLSAVYLNNRLSLGGANSRHMLVKYHWQQEMNMRDLLRAIHIPGELQCADANTKPLHGKLYWRHSATIMGETKLICDQLRASAIISAFAVAHRAERTAKQGERHPDLDDSGSEDYDAIHFARERLGQTISSAPPVLKLGKRYSSDCTGDGPGEEQKDEQQDHRIDLFAAHRQNTINIEARFSQEAEYITMVMEADVERFRREMQRARREREVSLEAQETRLGQELAAQAAFLAALPQPQEPAHHLNHLRFIASPPDSPPRLSPSPSPYPSPPSTPPPAYQRGLFSFPPDQQVRRRENEFFKEGSVGLFNVGPLRTINSAASVTASEVDGRSHIKFATEMGLIDDSAFHLQFLNSASTPRGGWTADSTRLAEQHAECIVHKIGYTLGTCYHHPACPSCRTNGVIRTTFYAVSIGHAKAVGMRASLEFGCCHNFWKPNGGQRKNPRRNQGE